MIDKVRSCSTTFALAMLFRDETTNMSPTMCPSSCPYVCACVGVCVCVCVCVWFSILRMCLCVQKVRQPKAFIPTFLNLKYVNNFAYDQIRQLIIILSSHIIIPLYVYKVSNLRPLCLRPSSPAAPASFRGFVINTFALPNICSYMTCVMCPRRNNSTNTYLLFSYS